MTGAGPGAPGTPVLGPTQGYSTFHPREVIRFNWSPVAGQYDTPLDRESAYELLKSKAERAAEAVAAAKSAEDRISVTETREAWQAYAPATLPEEAGPAAPTDTPAPPPHTVTPAHAIPDAHSHLPLTPVHSRN